MSILVGPFVGLNRDNLKRELGDFYGASKSSHFKRAVVLMLLWVAALGFFIPAIHPIIGALGGCIFIVFFHLSVIYPIATAFFGCVLLIIYIIYFFVQIRRNP